jgi:hypothetical protein
MRVMPLIFALVLFTAGSVSAQDWDLYTSKEDGFKVDFPGQPRMTTTTFKSEYGADLPTHVYSANRGQERYSMTVVDYNADAQLLDEKAKLTCRPGDERSCGLTQAGRGYWKEDMAGALLWATYGFIQRDGKMTHLAYAWQDLIWGHELQMVNPNGSRTFAFIAMHKNKLYILEGTTPKGSPPPVLFQQSMGYVDKDGNGVRYQGVYHNMYAEFPEFFPAQPRLTGQGGGGGRGAGAGAGDGRGAGAGTGGAGNTPTPAGR